MTRMEMVYLFFGGVAIFLLGMKYLSEGIQAVAGRKLRKMIAAVTNNRLMACCTGAFVTAVIQSSSVTTVMLVGLVNAGTATLAQSIGVLLGANIGTTITAWIVSLDVLEFGLPILALGALTFLFTKVEKWHYFAMLIMGLGMVFYGLVLMKDSIVPIKESARLVALMASFDATTAVGVAKCVLVGAFITAVIQSSSATVAITLTLAGTGVINFPTAVALVLGENIGTTVTAVIASLGTKVNARRVAFAHVLTKVIGVIILAIFFIPLLELLKCIGTNMNMEARVALAHTLFNVFLVVLMLPFTNVIARVVTRLMPDTASDAPRLTYLTLRMLDTPGIGIQQSFQEILRMADRSIEMMNALRAFILDEDNSTAERDIFAGEAQLDQHEHEIVQFLGKLIHGNITSEIIEETRKQLRLADEYESVSDYACGILKLFLRRKQSENGFSAKAREEVLILHDRVAKFLSDVTTAVRTGKTVGFSEVRVESDSITHFFKDLRQEHTTRVVTGACNANTGMIFVDILQAYRKLKDHALNIAEAQYGEK